MVNEALIASLWLELAGDRQKTGQLPGRGSKVTKI
jgi:hypothetical protein